MLTDNSNFNFVNLEIILGVSYYHTKNVIMILLFKKSNGIFIIAACIILHI